MFILCYIVFWAQIQICEYRALNQYANIKFTYFLCYIADICVFVLLLFSSRE